MGLLNSNNVLLVAGALAAILLVRFAAALAKHRRFYKDLPTPPHSFWTGNIVSFVSVQRTLPPDTHAHVVLVELAKRHSLGAVFYVDLFPFAPSIAVIHDPELAAQLIQERQLAHHPYVLNLTKAMMGANSLTQSRGPQWKMLRKMLTPGFTPAQLRGMTGAVAEAAGVLRERLAAFATSRQVFALQDVGGDVTADVISAIVLGRSFDCQRAYHPMAYYLRRCIGAHRSALNVVTESLDWFEKKWYTWRLNREVLRSIEERYESGEGVEAEGRTRAVVDLALDVYREDNLAAKRGHAKLEGEFKLLAVDAIKNLLVGGHDNNAVALAYVIHLLSMHPNVLDNVRKEHDSVFDRDAERTLELLISDPKRLKQLPLTTACIKETLRLFPPGNIPRMAPPGTFIKDSEGVSYPLWNHLVWVSTYGIHRREDIWPNASEFDPMRFLPPNQVPKDAWRPFDKGPRMCIGMELTMMELEVILLLVLREFDFETSYGPDAPVGPKEHGGVACQVSQFAPRPPEGMPMRVKKRV